MPEEEFVEQKSKKICLVSVFSHAAFFVPLSHLREILEEICPETHSILVVSPELTGSMAFDPKKDYVIFYKKQNSTLFRLMNYGVLNLKISKKILFGSKEVESYVFFWATGFLLPMICAKVRRKKIIWLLPSSMKKMDEHRGSFLRPAVILLQDLSYTIADKIVLYSPNLIQEWGLHRYADKILIAHEHFIQVSTCTAAPPLSGRPRLIGYIGRLSEEKGVRAFVQCPPGNYQQPKGPSVYLSEEPGRWKRKSVHFFRRKNSRISGEDCRLDLPRSPPGVSEDASAPRHPLLHRRSPQHHARGDGLRYSGSSHFRGGNS